MNDDHFETLAGALRQAMPGTNQELERLSALRDIQTAQFEAALDAEDSEVCGGDGEIDLVGLVAAQVVAGLAARRRRSWLTPREILGLVPSKKRWRIVSPPQLHARWRR